MKNAKAHMANSALVQPILINVLTDEVLDEFFKSLKNHGIINIKPEFLTVNIKNMVLMAQILEMYDKDILKKMFELYFKEENISHIKQRGRTAPKRDLIEREKTGKGKFVNVSLLESALSMVSVEAVRYLNIDKIACRNGNRHNSIAPYNSYKAKDGYVLIIKCGFVF